jgi:hypothetical protein
VGQAEGHAVGQEHDTIGVAGEKILFPQKFLGIGDELKAPALPFFLDGDVLSE